jgi:hypothetical protein
LLRWGVPKNDSSARKTPEILSKVLWKVRKLLARHGWKRYLLVTSGDAHAAQHAGVFATCAGSDSRLRRFFGWKIRPDSLRFFPTEAAAEELFATIHEYVGWVNYYCRLHFFGT